MNKWIWLHPLRGGAFLVNMSNVCYLFGDENDNTKLVLANGKEIIVHECEDFILKALKS